jgi:hypothetical protein
MSAGSLPALAKSRRTDPIRMLDTDNDGTVDLAEAKKAASALFERLDPDRDGTLDKRELAGRLSAKELAAADPDHDGTLTKDEYLAVVEQRFNAANPRQGWNSGCQGDEFRGWKGVAAPAAIGPRIGSKDREGLVSHPRTLRLRSGCGGFRFSPARSSRHNKMRRP